MRSVKDFVKKKGREALLLGSFGLAALVGKAEAESLSVVDSFAATQPYSSVLVNGDKVVTNRSGAGTANTFDKNNLANGIEGGYSTGQNTRDAASVNGKNLHYDGASMVVGDNDGNALPGGINKSGYDHLGAAEIGGVEYAFFLAKSGDYEIVRISDKVTVETGTLPGNYFSSTGLHVEPGRYKGGTKSDKLEDAVWYVCDNSNFVILINHYVSTSVQGKTLSINVGGNMQDIALDEVSSTTANVYLASDLWALSGLVARVAQSGDRPISYYLMPDVEFEYATQTDDEGTTQPVVNVVLSNPAKLSISVDYEINQGTAKAGVDYTGATTGTLTFNKGESMKTIPFEVINDSTYENSEDLTMTLSNAVGARIGSKNSHIQIIGNDDSKPVPYFEDAINVGKENVANQLKVILPEAAEVDLEYLVKVNDGTATQGDDYDLTFNKVSFPAGATEAYININPIQP